MNVVVALCLLFITVSSQGPNGHSVTDKLEAIEKEIVALKEENDAKQTIENEQQITALKRQNSKLSSSMRELEWLKSGNYCILKQGDCPKGFKAVSTKTWLAEGASGGVSYENIKCRMPWESQASQSFRTEPVMRKAKQKLSKIGDSYIEKKCYTTNDMGCPHVKYTVVFDENGIPYGNINRDDRMMFHVDYNSLEFVLHACCKQ